MVKSRKILEERRLQDICLGFYRDVQLRGWEIVRYPIDYSQELPYVELREAVLTIDVSLDVSTLYHKDLDTVRYTDFTLHKE